MPASPPTMAPRNTSSALPHVRKLALAVALTLTQTAHAILINNNVANNAGGVVNYWDSANKLPSVVSLYLPNQNASYCTGSLINSRTVLTAAHCLADEKTGLLATHPSTSQIRFTPDSTVQNSNDRTISGAAIHHLYNPTGGVFGDGDIALVSLAAPVTAVPTIQLIRAGDPQPAVGSLVTIAGYGQAGDGSGNTITDDYKRRIAQTNIGLYGKLEPGQLTQVYLAQFRDPNSPASPDDFELKKLGVPVPSLQGSNAPGDSGGPLFLVRPDGSLVQVGTVIGSPNDIGPRYGLVSMWTSTAWYNDWIDANNPLRSTSVAAGNHLWSDAAAWTDTQGRHDAPNNADGDVVNGRGRSGRYYQVRLSQPGALTLDMNPTIDALAINGADAKLSIPGGRTLTVLTDTQLQNGRIDLAGKLSTASFGMSGGQLRGTGTLEASNGVAASGGTIMPGTPTATGTLTINGDYVQGAGAALAVRADGAASDRLVVTGMANLSGAALVMASPGAGYRPGVNYRFLTAAGGLSGNFSRVGTDLAFLTPTLSRDTNSASFSVIRNTTPFAAAADANSGGVARAIDTLGWNSALYTNIAGSNAAQAAAKLTVLSGQSFASATGAMTDQSRLLRDAVSVRMRQGVSLASPLADNTGGGDNDAAHEAPRSGAWAQASGNWGRIGGSNGMAAVDTSGGGIMAGYEQQLNADWLGGVAASFNRSNSNAGALQASAAVDSYGLAAYGSTGVDAWRFRVGAGYAWHQIDHGGSGWAPVMRGTRSTRAAH